VASSCAYSVCTWPAASAISATAPFSATMAATGQVAAKGTLQPCGRPVIATTGTPAARSVCSACSATGSMAPSRVSVSSMSVISPTTPAQARGGNADSGRDGRP
jgi:hypothetical protein